MVRQLTLAFLLLAHCALPANFSLAAGIDVRPFLIDLELDPRETKSQVITLQNNYPTRKAVLYATVNEISVDATGEIKEFQTPVMTDRTNTVTSWIEIGRGRIEVMPGEKAEVPLTVRVHPQAEPGVYHVFVGLVEAAKRDIAEAVALAGNADGVIVKVTIEDQRQDSMRISQFLIDRFVTNEDSKQIIVEIENMGDLPSVPSGEIIFYDSRGVEVDSVNVQAQSPIQPGDISVIDAQIPMTPSLGRFKANLSLSYGQGHGAALHDTTYFYMIPLQILALLMVAVVAVSLVITLLLRRAMGAQHVYEDGDEVIMYVKEGHDPQPKDHDIDLKKNSS